MNALLDLLAPPTRVVRSAKPPKMRKSCCAKCPFGTGLTDGEQSRADLLKARLAGRLSAGENVVWGCHETASGKSPAICPGFIEWTRPRPELER